jgi:ABC-type uncharacterized transport system auxiliary subunit
VSGVGCRKTTRRTPTCATFLAVCLLLAGCSVVGSTPAVRTYRLDYPPPAPDPSTSVGPTLRVVPFGIASLYDRQGFVYRDGRYDIGVDSYHRWLTAPAAMITDLIARDLSATRQFSAVLQGASSLAATYELSGTIEELEERPDGGCSAHLRMRVLLAELPDKGRRRVVFEDVLAADEPCTRGDPESFVAAMSRAVQHVSEQLQAQVRAAGARS